MKLLLEQIHLYVNQMLSFDNSPLSLSILVIVLCECVNQTTIKGVIMSFVDVCQHRKSNALEVRIGY